MISIREFSLPYNRCEADFDAEAEGEVNKRLFAYCRTLLSDVDISTSQYARLTRKSCGLSVTNAREAQELLSGADIST